MRTQVSKPRACLVNLHLSYILWMALLGFRSHSLTLWPRGPCFWRPHHDTFPSAIDHLKIPPLKAHSTNLLMNVDGVYS